jgi:hypothetical protein
MPWPTARHDFQRTGFVETAVNPTPFTAVVTSVTGTSLAQQIFLPLLANQANPRCSP